MSPSGTKVDAAATRPGTGKLVQANRTHTREMAHTTQFSIYDRGFATGMFQVGFTSPGQPNAATFAAAPETLMNLTWLTYQLRRGGSTPSSPPGKGDQAGSGIEDGPGEALGGDSSNPSSVGTGGAAGSLGQGTPLDIVMLGEGASPHAMLGKVQSWEGWSRELGSGSDDGDAPKGPRGENGYGKEQQTVRGSLKQDWGDRGRGQ